MADKNKGAGNDKDKPPNKKRCSMTERMLVLAKSEDVNPETKIEDCNSQDTVDPLMRPLYRTFRKKRKFLGMRRGLPIKVVPAEPEAEQDESSASPPERSNIASVEDDEEEQGEEEDIPRSDDTQVSFDIFTGEVLNYPSYNSQDMFEGMDSDDDIVVQPTAGTSAQAHTQQSQDIPVTRVAETQEIPVTRVPETQEEESVPAENQQETFMVGEETIILSQCQVPNQKSLPLFEKLTEDQKQRIRAVKVGQLFGTFNHYRLLNDKLKMYYEICLAYPCCLICTHCGLSIRGHEDQTLYRFGSMKELTKHYEQRHQKPTVDTCSWF